MTSRNFHFVLWLSGSLLFGLPALGAQPEPGTLVAAELAVKADALYGAGDFAGAARLYRQFATDFGQSPQAGETLRRMRTPLALCLVHMKDWPGAQEAVEEALHANPPLPFPEAQELTFWLGVCHLQQNHPAEARAALEKFCSLATVSGKPGQTPAAVRAKLPEAGLLIGSTFLQENNFSAAAAHYAAIKSSFPAATRGRAVVLELHALLQAGETDTALEGIVAEFPRLHELPQAAAFQLLTLDLAERFLQQGEFRKAVLCLQRSWSKDRLLNHQQTRIQELEERLHRLESMRGGDPCEKIQTAQLLCQIQAERQTLAKIENFDSSLRLRLATAYQGMERYRESALILEDMLKRMPPDKIVETASVNLIQCWQTAERWPEAVAAARLFEKKFPHSPQLPLVLYLAGIAEQRSDHFSEAVTAFDHLARTHSQSEFAPRALFMKAFCQLQAGSSAEAIATFDAYLKRFPKHDLAESAVYWRAMGLSFAGEFASCRDAMDKYLQSHPRGSFRGRAVFRKAYCAQRLKDFPISISEWKNYLREFPREEESSEAKILLGDALLQEGRAEEGIEVWNSVPPEDSRHFTEAAFKIAKARRLLEDFDGLRADMVRYQKTLPRSPRVAEAIYWIGWTCHQQGQPEEARTAYWEAIDAYGNDPDIRSVEDLFPALAKLYRDETTAYLAELEKRHLETGKSAQTTFAARLLWAQSRALKKSDPERSRRILLQIPGLLHPSLTNPLVMEDIARTYEVLGRTEEAAFTYRELVRWNPTSPQKANALAALGIMAKDAGRAEEALEYFDRFLRETGGSPEFGRVMLAKAELLAHQQKNAECRQALNDLLAHPTSTGREKAEALFRLGEMYMAEHQPGLAIPYYQRIYVMHRRWRTWTARAYVRSAEAFEQLRDLAAARRTYEELADSDDLADAKERTTARRRLEELRCPTSG